jgi:MoxR-like ATPase
MTRDENPQSTVPAAIRPEEMLEDKQDAKIVNGIKIRKGTLGAFIANARKLDAYPVDSPERAEILGQLRAFAPAVRALGLLEVFEPRSEVLQRIFAEAEPLQ